MKNNKVTQKVMTSKGGKAAPVNPLLQAAARSLIQDMQTPAIFLSFLTDALTWAHDYDSKYPPKDGDTAHFFLLHFVECVVPAWYAGGTAPEELITIAMKDISDCFGGEYYKGPYQRVVSAFGRECEISTFSGDFSAGSLHGLYALANVGRHLSAMG